MVAARTGWQQGSATGYLILSDGFVAEYFVRGDGDPLVLVPALAGGTGLLRPLIDELSQDHQVITFELRGEKECLCDRSYHFDRLVRDLGEIVDQLALERPSLCGVSFGGAIALDFASRFPNRVGSLVVQGAGAVYRDRLFDNVARKVLDRLLLPGDNPFVNQFFRLLTAQSSQDRFGLDFAIDNCWTTDQSVMAHRFVLLEEYDVTGRLGRLRMPTLLLTGERDVLQSADDMRVITNEVPQAELRMVAGAGHFAFVTHAEVLAAEIRSFQRLAAAAY
jgi:pimeloyl-ACP methyl ester carboxylesterase